MKVMYIAFMFHTNQVPIMKGWIESGQEAVFVSQTKGNTEDHTVCTPYLLGYSRLFVLINGVHKQVTIKKNKYSSFPEAFEGHYAFPSIYKLVKLYRKMKPDLLVLRDRSVYSVFCYVAAGFCGIPSILYNQTPLFEESLPKSDLLHWIMRSITPKVRMTPVYGKENSPYKEENAYYVPFVIQPRIAPEQRQFFSGGKMNLLCVAKYEERKNQIMLLEIIRELMTQYEFHVVLVGEMSTEHHKRYYDKINQYIMDNDMQDITELYYNYPPEKMGEHYCAADIFVLPSTKEFASVSQLEAMAYSVPVIVSDTNGTACYIENEVNGYTFEDNNKADLKRKLQLLLDKKEKILQMGQNGYNKVIHEYSFARYEENIRKLYEKATKSNEEKRRNL